MSNRTNDGATNAETSSLDIVSSHLKIHYVQVFRVFYDLCSYSTSNEDGEYNRWQQGQ